MGTIVARNCGYDKLDRITKAGNELFAFDPAHNILSDGLKDKAVTDNRIRECNGTSYYYDDFGNLIHRELPNGEVQNYFYDLHDQLIKVEIFKKDGSKQTWHYIYDALGRRIAKYNELSDGLKAEEREFVWDGSHLLQEVYANGRYTYIYTDVDSYEPLAQIHNWTNEEKETYQDINYFHCDQIGIPREMTGKDGRLLWFGDYFGWGKLKSETNITNAHQPFRLQNQYCDAETGLHYNFFRYYDPDVGRFFNQDPIGLWGGENFYQFAPNAQFWIDSLGLARICTRPLNGMPFNFRTSGWTGLDVGIFHEHIFFDDGSNIGFTTTGLFQETDPKMISSYKCSGEHYDDFKMKKSVAQVAEKRMVLPKSSNRHDGVVIGKKYGNNTYNVASNNCQDFSSDVKNAYKNIK